MDNYQIADSFSLLSKLMDIHGENSFKSKSYASAAFAIEKLGVQLKDIAPEKIAELKGIGSSSAQKITELLQTGRLKSLEEIIFLTPPGIIEMLNIKGIGPKKINTIWKEMEIETVGELLYACKENRLKLYKGFGEKTQQNVIDTIEFYFKNKGSHLYAQVIVAAEQMESFLAKIFPGKRIAITGSFKQQTEIIDELEFIIETSEEDIEKNMKEVEGFTLKEKNNDCIVYDSGVGIKVKLYASAAGSFIEKLITHSSSESFITELKNNGNDAFNNAATEESFFEKAGISFIPAYLREDPALIARAKTGILPPVLQPTDIKGIIHSHSNWSDGSHTIEEMAIAARESGIEYLVISDHSKTAFYANGLSEDRIREQHLYIDELNAKLAPFKIFKSIESDILNDGSLDYSNEVLATFDLVIASVHSNLKMTEEKAMMRLLNAIENPYTTILGHMTGRLLLSRPGYPVDYKKIIDACAANHVTIELNAHPSRLDIDWRQIHYALEKNVLISIDPDAHHIDGIKDTNYGVLVAQKALVTKENNLSSFGLKEFEAFIDNRKKIKNI
ncbi:MAG: helix-hairpin-helix domain-containing protein [Ferruginibacter sp.]